jgi:sigma-B regulation protein RsbU (phosphoserine phosphatase)
MNNLFDKLRRLFRFYTGELNYNEFQKLVKKDVPEVYDFYVRRMKKPDKSRNRVWDFILFTRNLFLEFLNLLTPVRRIIYSIGLVLFILAYLGNDWGFAIWGFVLINLLVAFELADKLTAKDELEVAREIQLNMMPKVPPENKFYEISCYMETAREVGGDYYDFIKPDINNDKTFIIIGDVSGKGMSAALHMVQVQSILHNIVKEDTSPREILYTLNQNLKRVLRKGTFLTLSVAEVNSRGEIILSRAGHMPLLHYSKPEGKCCRVTPKGMGIGLAGEPVFSNSMEQISLKPHPGDLFVFFTDGIVEAMDSNYRTFGEGNLTRLICDNSNKSAGEIQNIIINAVKNFTYSSPVQDDFTLIIMKAV